MGNRTTNITRKARQLPLARGARRTLVRGARDSAAKVGTWTFLTNHAHVLITLALHEGIILREIAALVGITERAVQKIIAELADEGFLERVKVGRRNQYKLHLNQPLHLLLPVILLSGFIFPVENMPQILQWLSYIIPAKWFLIII